MFQMQAWRAAEALFLSCLTAPQLRDYRQHGYFRVEGSRGGRYIIDCEGACATVYNVIKLNGGIWRRRKRIRLCAVPRDLRIPQDIWLAQKLVLESDEDSFLRNARKTSRGFLPPGLDRLA